MPTHLILLAAGAGTRMASERPKVLHEIAGAPLFQHALASAAELDGERVLVVGHGADQVREAALDIDQAITFVHQEQQLGTAHAVSTAAPALQGKGGDTLMLFGDTPFIRPETIAKMATARADGADIIFLGFHAADPGRYGRMVTEGDDLLKIVEWKDADETTRAITLCNSGVVLADTGTLLRLAAAVGSDNRAGEHYLTDIAELGRSESLSVKVVTCPESETMGINTRSDLADAERVFQSPCPCGGDGTRGDAAGP